MFDDVVEHCGEGAHKYLSACFPAFMDGVAEVCCKTSCTVARLTQVACVPRSHASSRPITRVVSYFVPRLR